MNACYKCNLTIHFYQRRNTYQKEYNCTVEAWLWNQGSLVHTPSLMEGVQNSSDKWSSQHYLYHYDIWHLWKMKQIRSRKSEEHVHPENQKNYYSNAIEATCGALCCILQVLTVCCPSFLGLVSVTKPYTGLTALRVAIKLFQQWTECVKWLLIDVCAAIDKSTLWTPPAYIAGMFNEWVRAARTA